MFNEDFKQVVFDYYWMFLLGKIKVFVIKFMLIQCDLLLVYLLGVVYVCEVIKVDLQQVSELIVRGNLVVVIFNGIVVLGLGNIGVLVGKLVMEGKGVLFQKFVGIDVFDIEVDEIDLDKLVDIIVLLELIFGGINLEDIKVLECFVVECKLCECMKILVFYDDQYGMVIIVGVVVFNVMVIIGKKIEEVKLVIMGMGVVGIFCVNMLVQLGLKLENILVFDCEGVIYIGCIDLDLEKQCYVCDIDKCILVEIVDGVDIFLGLLVLGILIVDMVKIMVLDLVIFVLVNLILEIMLEVVCVVCLDVIIGIGCLDYLNQVNNVLCFLYLFCGVLDVGVIVINEEMKIVCVCVIVVLVCCVVIDMGLVYGGEILSFGCEYLILCLFDCCLLVELLVVVVQVVMDLGVVLCLIEDMGVYCDKLVQFVYCISLMMKLVYDCVCSDKQCVVYVEGEEEVVLQVVQNVVDDGLVYLILIGCLEVIELCIECFGLCLKIGENVEVININDDLCFNEYWQYYYGLIGCCGVIVVVVKNLMCLCLILIVVVMVVCGEVDVMLIGIVGCFYKKLGYVCSVLLLELKVILILVMIGVINQQGVFFFVDIYVQEDLIVEQLCEVILQVVYCMKLFGIELKVVLLLYFNFGSYDLKDVLKMCQVCELLFKCNLCLNVDGEMQGDIVWDEVLCQKLLLGLILQGCVNLFVLLNFEVVNIVYNLVCVFIDGVVIGLILMGVNKLVYILIISVILCWILNMIVIVVVDVQICKQIEVEKKV